MVRPAVRPVFVVIALICALPFPALAQLRATVVATGLNRPVGFVQHPTDPDTQLILEQGGRVRVLRDGALHPEDYLDLSSEVAAGGEQGLLGLAFAPNHVTNGRVFVSFTNRAGDSVIARFTRLAGNPRRADPSSRFDLVWPGGRRVIEQPFSNHNGGHLAFGPDGYLYVGFGDGGSGDDPMNFAQNPGVLLGKMLRIDVNVPAGDPEGYDVPSTNPFVGRAGVLPEIWSVGWRNPWRWSFDDPVRGGTGALVAGDVGQGAWEEVDYEPANRGGRNYGWRNREGAHDHVTSTPPFPTPLRDPVFEYSRTEGRSITGGYVYRGARLGNAYRGRYFFGDFVTSRVWSVALTIEGGGDARAHSLVEHSAELGIGAASPSSFGVDGAGELYIVSYGGQVYRIEAAENEGPGPGVPGSPRRPRTGDPVGTARPRPR